MDELEFKKRVLEILRKSENNGKLNGCLLCLRDDDYRLQIVLSIALEEKWERLEKNVQLLIIHPQRRNMDVDDTVLVDFLDNVDALREELKLLKEE